MRYFWLLLLAIAVVLASIAFYQYISPAALKNDQIANVFYLGILAVLAASAVLRFGTKPGHILRSAFIWLVILFALMIGYNNRYALQDTGHRLTAGLIPASPVSGLDNQGNTTVTLRRTANGHFEARAAANGTTVHFMVDTGATNIVLTHRDAQRIGIRTDMLKYTIPVSTANGRTRTASITLDSLKIGEIERRNVHALVARPDALDTSLLGMEFLNRLSGFKVQGDQLILVN